MQVGTIRAEVLASSGCLTGASFTWLEALGFSVIGRVKWERELRRGVKWRVFSPAYFTGELG